MLATFSASRSRWHSLISAECLSGQVTKGRGVLRIENIRFRRNQRVV